MILIIVFCIFIADDQLSLASATVSQIPDKIWPILERYHDLTIEVINKGDSIAKDDTNGIFSVSEIFSIDDTLDVGDGSGFEVLQNDAAFLYKSAINTGSTVKVSGLKGIALFTFQ